MPTHNTVIHTTMMPTRAPLSSSLRKADDQNEALPRIGQKQDKNKPSQPPRQQPETYRELLEQEYSVAAAQRDGLIDLHGELRNLQESGAPIDWSKFHSAALARISEMAAQFPDATGHSVMTMPASRPEEAERVGAIESANYVSSLGGLKARVNIIESAEDSYRIQIVSPQCIPVGGVMYVEQLGHDYRMFPGKASSR